MKNFDFPKLKIMIIAMEEYGFARGDISYVNETWNDLYNEMQKAGSRKTINFVKDVLSKTEVVY